MRKSITFLVVSILFLGCKEKPPYEEFDLRIERFITRDDSASRFIKHAYYHEFEKAKEIYPKFFELNLSSTSYLDILDIQDRHSYEFFIGSALIARNALNGSATLYDNILQQCLQIKESDLAYFLLAEVRAEYGFCGDVYYCLNRINPDLLTENEKKVKAKLYEAYKDENYFDKRITRSPYYNEKDLREGKVEQHCY